MNLAYLLALSVLLLPTVDKHTAVEIQKSLNQSVEIQVPDAQEIENLKILAGGKTDKGDYLYICEGDLVWTLDRQEYLEQYKSIVKNTPFGEVSAQLANRLTPKFDKGDLITRVRMRVRFEEAGDDIIAISSKTTLLDLGVSSAIAKSSTD